MKRHGSPDPLGRRSRAIQHRGELGSAAHVSGGGATQRAHSPAGSRDVAEHLVEERRRMPAAAQLGDHLDVWDDHHVVAHGVLHHPHHSIVVAQLPPPRSRVVDDGDGGLGIGAQPPIVARMSGSVRSGRLGIRGRGDGTGLPPEPSRKAEERGLTDEATQQHSIIRCVEERGATRPLAHQATLRRA